MVNQRDEHDPRGSENSRYRDLTWNAAVQAQGSGDVLPERRAD
jgi:hypothetical protein